MTLLTLNVNRSSKLPTIFSCGTSACYYKIFKLRLGIKYAMRTNYSNHSNVMLPQVSVPTKIFYQEGATG
jgi:hypothetical protein